MIDIVMLARGYVFDDVHRTHYEGCESEHVSCLMRKLADEIERLHADNQAAVAAYAAEITEAKAESERLREELAAAQKDAARYWWVARNCDVWHPTFGAIGSNRELDAAMAKESERE